MIKKKDDLCVLGAVGDINCEMDNKMRWYHLGGNASRHFSIRSIEREREGEVTTVCQR